MRRLRPREMPAFQLGAEIVTLEAEIALLRLRGSGTKKLEPLLRRLADLKAARSHEPNRREQ